MKIRFLILIIVIGGIHSAISQTSGGGVDYLYAKKLFNDGMYDLAATQFHDFAEQNPLSPQAADALLLAGDSYFKLNQFEQARKEYVYLILRYPEANNLDQAQYKIGECLREQGNLFDGAKAFRQVKVIYPKSKYAENALFEAGRLFFEGKQYELAIETFYVFLEEFSRSSLSLDVQLALAKTFLANGDIRRASAEVNKILETTKKGEVRAQTLFFQAEIEQSLGKIDVAEDIYLSVLKEYSSPKNQFADILTKTGLKLAYIYRQKGQYEESNKYISNASANNKTKILMGDNYYDLGEFSKAIEQYKSVQESAGDSLSLMVLFRQAVSYEKMNDFQNAIAFFKIIIDSCKQAKNSAYCENSYLSIAKSYLESGSPQIALKYLKDYQINYPQGNCRDKVNFKIANIYEHDLYEYERALRIYYDFIGEFPESYLVDDAQLGIAICYEKLKNYNQTIIEYKKYLQFYPGAEKYDEIERKVDYLTTVFAKGETSTLNQFAALLGDVINSPQQDMMTYKLALTYFNELKDYQTAISLFKKCKLSQANIPQDELFYYIGKSYQNLAVINLYQQDKKSVKLDSAQVTFARLLNQYPQSEWGDRATIGLLETRLMMTDSLSRKNEVTIKMMSKFISQYPQSDFIDFAYYHVAHAYIGSGVNDSAKVLYNYQKVIEGFPNSNYIGSAHFGKAIAYLNLNRTNKAITELVHYIQKFPQHKNIVKAHFLLSKLYRQQAQYDDALIYLKKISNRYFYSIYADSAASEIGALYMKTKKFSEGIQFFQQLQHKHYSRCSLDNAPQNNFVQEIVFRLAQFYKESGDNQNAMTHFFEYLKRFPNGHHVADILFALGELYNTNKSSDQDMALSFFKRVLNDYQPNPNVFQANIYAGDILFNQEEYISARQYFLNALKVTEDKELKKYPTMQSIICLYKIDQVAKGDEEVKQFKKEFDDLDEQLGQIELAKGDYYFGRKFFDTSEEIYKSAKSKFKKTKYGPLAELRLGKQYLILNKDDDALKILTEMPQKFPESEVIPDVYIALGEFYYFKARQPENAMLAFKNAIDHPAVTEKSLLIGMNYLIKTYFDLQMWDQALMISRKYIELAPLAENAFDTRIQIGVIYNKLNEYDRAIDYLTRLKREADSESEPRIQFWIADSYWEKGYFEKAIIEYLKVKYISKPTKLNWAVTAQYKAGLAYMKLDKNAEAKKLFEKIILEQGAESPFGKGAQKKIEEIDQVNN